MMHGQNPVGRENYVYYVPKRQLCLLEMFITSDCLC